MITEKVYLGRDNTIDLLLKADGAAVDLESVSRMVLVVGSVTVDSAVYPAAFDWDTGTTGKVILALGQLMDGEEPPANILSAGAYTATLTVYDPTNDDGLVWAKLKIVVE